MTAQRLPLITVFISVLVACSEEGAGAGDRRGQVPADHSTGNERLESAAAQWEESQPARYVVQTCTIGVYPPGCVRAAVEDGVTIAIEERIFAAGIGWEQFEPSRSPLDDLFSRVREGDTDECELADVDYDREFGFVDWYELSCEGTEGGRWVACFEPDTLELDACDIVPAE